MMLTATQYALLKTELQSDPASLGYAAKIAAHDFAGVAALLASTNAAWTCTQPQIPLTLLLQWYAGGPGQKIADYAANASNNAAQRSVCIAAALMFNGAMPYLDLSQKANQTMLTSLVSGGVLSATDQTNLLALQTLSGATRAQTVLGIPGIVASDWDCRHALGV